MDQISPELALVDAELAARARRRLPDPADCLTIRASGPTILATPAEIGAPVAMPRRPSMLNVITTLLVAAVVGSPLIDLLPADVGARPILDAAPPAPTSKESAVAEPQAPTVSVQPLRWPKARGAAFYSVVVWKDGAKAVTLWPTTNRLPASVIAERVRGLEPGAYRWFVYPAFRVGGQTRFGEVIRSGELRIP